MSAPSPRTRLACGLFAFTLIWLVSVPIAVAGDGDRSDSAASTGQEVTSSGPEVAPAVQPLLLPDVFSPWLPPVDRAAAPRAQIAPAPKPARGLWPLFASYGVLQALDVQSTLKAVSRGASEQNTVMAPFVRRPAAFVAFKAGLTAATLVAANRLSKRNRIASYALMIGLDSAYAIIVAHNYRVANGLR